MALFAQPVTTRRPPLWEGTEPPTLRPPAIRPAAANFGFGEGGVRATRQRLSSDEARERLGGRPVRAQGESIGSYNRRLGRFGRQFNNLTSGFSARERADAARAIAQAGGSEEQQQWAWWNGPSADVPGVDGGAGTHGAPPGPGAPGTASTGSIADDFIRKLMTGEAGPYTAELQSNLSAESASKRAADLKNANEGAYLSAARSGTAFSPGTAATLNANAQTARAGLSSDVAGIRNAATTANFGARIEGLNQFQTLTQREYQDRWNRATDATQRLAIEKEFAAKMAEIEAQKQIAAEGRAAAGAAAGRDQSQWIERFNLQNTREDELYQRDLPIELFRQFGGWLGN